MLNTFAAVGVRRCGGHELTDNLHMAYDITPIIIDTDASLEVVTARTNLTRHLYSTTYMTSSAISTIAEVFDE